jgi:diaminopimelate epimerase
MVITSGRPFYKMSGSGNDFVVVDTRREPPRELEHRERVAAICARGTGVGADGVVFLGASADADVRMTYLNADGSRAMCGNASLCTARLAVELGAARPEALTLETDAGIVRGRMRGGKPELDLQPATALTVDLRIDLQAGERRAAFADTGVPHVVILCDDVETVDVVGRGRPLRYDPRFAAGTNVNFVSRQNGTWRMRTYERGVEAETLACGTGAVATAIALAEWGESGERTSLLTRSGLPLEVGLKRPAGAWEPSLSGEARVVFEGRLSEV